MVMDYPSAMQQAICPPEAREAGQVVCREVGRMLSRMAAAVRLASVVVDDEDDYQTLALATVIEIGAELSAATILLLDSGLTYAAAALLRQLVEVEYLAWALAEKPELAQEWAELLDHDERKKYFEPGQLRRDSDGLFRKAEYKAHCEAGGHPHPFGLDLLENETPGFDMVEPVELRAGLLWDDTTLHLVGIWDYFVKAVRSHPFGHMLTEASQAGVNDAVQAWRQVAAEARKRTSARYERDDEAD